MTGPITDEDLAHIGSYLNCTFATKRVTNRRTGKTFDVLVAIIHGKEWRIMSAAHLATMTYADFLRQLHRREIPDARKYFPDPRAYE